MIAEKSRGVVIPFLLLLGFVFTNVALFSQQTLSGKIIDLNNKGVSGVVVSDGFNISKSDKKGNFVLEQDSSAKFVFISTPSGYEQESSFYIRTDKQPASPLVFKVRKVENQPGSFIHMGDTEATIYKDWVDALKDYISNHKLAFVLFNGDICYEKGLKFHAREITKESMGVRVVYTVGNHDLVAGDYGEQLFENLFGPVWYSFNVGGVHFVNIPVNYGDKNPGYTTDQIYNWLRKDLDAIPQGTPVVLMNHHLYGYSEDFLMKTERQQLNLMDYNLKGYLYAHYHTNLFKLTKKGVFTFSTMSPNKGGIDHSPSSFRVISFNKKGDLSSKLIYSTLNNHVVANGYYDGSYKVVANIYDTGSDVVKASVLTGDSEYLLKQNSSWSWSAVIPNTATNSNNNIGQSGEKMFFDGDFRLRIKVIFSDGSVVIKNVITDNQPKIKWVANMGGNSFMASPTMSNGLVISATVDDDTTKNEGIHAFDRFTGERKWSIKTESSVKNNMAVWNGTLLACDVGGRLYAVDIPSGKIIWARDLRENSIHPVFTQGVTVNNGVVYAGHGYNLSAVRISDGVVIWTNTAWKGGVSTIASPVVDSLSDVLLTGGYWLGRFAHQASTGKLLWEKRDNDSRICDNTPVAFSGSFFYTSPNYITEVDPITGVEKVKLKINYSVNSNSRPFVNEKYYIVGTADKGVVAFDRSDNYKELWNFKVNPALVYTAPYTKDFQMTVESGPFLSGERVYFGANDGFLYCVDASNGLFRWRINLGAPVLSNVVVENGLLYVNDLGGNLWCIDDI